jgi:hypothetical protein
MAIMLPYLEMPITHICSLHCDGCSAYSNYSIKRTVPLPEAREWLKAWSKRVAPVRFRILGGEPFLHPNLPEIILSARQFWPAAHIEIVTNGLNIDRHPTMPFILSLPAMSLHLSVHSRDEKYLAQIDAAMARINRWIADFGVTARAGDNISFWNRFYKGVGQYMEPFEGDAVASWKVCHSRICCNLIENRLWKCPQIGNLHLVSERFGLEKNPRWAKWLEYKGIGLECTDDELQGWVRARAGPESVCELCPSHLEHYEKDIYNINFELPNASRCERPTNQPASAALSMSTA